MSNWLTVIRWEGVRNRLLPHLGPRCHLRNCDYISGRVEDHHTFRPSSHYGDDCPTTSIIINGVDDAFYRCFNHGHCSFPEEMRRFS